MSRATPSPAGDDSVARAAARWVLRQDRGLTAEEQDAFSQWLGQSATHREAWAEHTREWTALDRLVGLPSSACAVPDPDLLAPRQPHPVRRFAMAGSVVLAIAAAVAIMIYMPKAPAPGATARPARALVNPALARIERRGLPDGSEVELNRGSVLAVEFTPAERRVRLVRGEASFMVAKNPARPFVVIVQGVEVRAVGTVFNVRLGPETVEVLVTEGKVRVEHADALQPDAWGTAAPLLAAGEHAIVPLSPSASAPPVARLSAAQITEKLAWQPRLLDFADAPLADIAAEFNRHNAVQLLLSQPALAKLRLSASFRSDNVEGFVRLMESDFGMIVERRDDFTIVLRSAR